jgi:hypothetical protein
MKVIEKLKRKLVLNDMSNYDLQLFCKSAEEELKNRIESGKKHKVSLLENLITREYYGRRSRQESKVVVCMTESNEEIKYLCERVEDVLNDSWMTTSDMIKLVEFLQEEKK